MFRRFENLNVKGKMNFGYVVVIVLMIVSGIFSMTGLEILNSSLNNFVDGANKADTAIKICRLDINIAARNIREMALNEDTSSYPEYKQKVEETLQD